jgi:hypothetical protein
MASVNTPELALLGPAYKITLREYNQHANLQAELQAKLQNVKKCVPS